MKRCTKCGRRKPLSAFRQFQTARAGKSYAECKSCRRAREYLRAEMSRRWIREYAARWRSKTRSVIDAADTFIELSTKRQLRLADYHLLRHQAIVAYGGYRCACCGIREALFLTIDHINNGGTQHRRRVGSADGFLKWLRENDYPPGFQVLCSNCNSGRYRNRGVCPHQDPVGRTPAFVALGRVLCTAHQARISARSPLRMAAMRQVRPKQLQTRPRARPNRTAK